MAGREAGMRAVARHHVADERLTRLANEEAMAYVLRHAHQLTPASALDNYFAYRAAYLEVAREAAPWRDEGAERRSARAAPDAVAQGGGRSEAANVPPGDRTLVGQATPRRRTVARRRSRRSGAMEVTRTTSGQQHRPRYTLRWCFRGEGAEAEYAAVRERMAQLGWRELDRWGGPQRFVVEFGGETPPDWAATVLAAGSQR
jgi:hypothetical protein